MIRKARVADFLGAFFKLNLLSIQPLGHVMPQPQALTREMNRSRKILPALPTDPMVNSLPLHPGPFGDIGAGDQVGIAALYIPAAFM